jgi:predicted transcriptional regulator
MEAHLVNIFWISISTGLFGGIINFLQLDEEEYCKTKFLKSIVIGIGASFVVPLFLQTISSDLINQCKTDGKYYFIFAGFCLIASIFSRRFLNTVADAVIKKAEEAEKKAEQAIETATMNEEKVSALVDKNSEPEEQIDLENSDISFINEDIKGKLKTDIQNIINVFKSSKYTYRTAKGIAKDIGTDLSVVEMTLSELEIAGIIKKLPSENKILWSLTEKGNQIK